MCIFKKDMYVNPRVWLIKKKSIKSHIEDGERVYDLPIMLFADLDRPAEHWDIYASRQLVNYVSGKNIYKLTQSYSKRQYDKIKKGSFSVFDTEGNEYYMFEATAFPKYHIVKDAASKQRMIKQDIDNGVQPANYMTPAEYSKECFHKGFKGDPPIIVNIRDFDYECYPDNKPVVYVKSTSGRGSASADAYIKLPRENKLTMDDVIKHNCAMSTHTEDQYYIAKFDTRPGAKPNNTEMIAPRNYKLKMSNYTVNSMRGDMADIPERISKLMASVRPLHLEYIERRKHIKDSNYIPKKIYTKDNIAEDTIKSNDDPMDFIHFDF